MGCVLPVPLSLAARGHLEGPPSLKIASPMCFPVKKGGVSYSAVTIMSPALPNPQKVTCELLGLQLHVMSAVARQRGVSERHSDVMWTYILGDG